MHKKHYYLYQPEKNRILSKDVKFWSKLYWAHSNRKKKSAIKDDVYSVRQKIPLMIKNKTIYYISKTYVDCRVFFFHVKKLGLILLTLNNMRLFLIIFFRYVFYCFWAFFKVFTLYVIILSEGRSEIKPKENLRNYTNKWKLISSFNVIIALPIFFWWKSELKKKIL